MVLICDALVTEHWPFLYTTQPSGAFLELQQWKWKVNLHEKSASSGNSYEVLSQITGRKYKFSPKAIMVEKNGANYCTIKEVVYFLTSKVVSCQMHCQTNVNKASLRLEVSFRDDLKNICDKMCITATVTQYNEQKKQLDEMANLLSDKQHGLPGGMPGNTKSFQHLEDLGTTT